MKRSVKLKAEGEEYTLCYSFNSLCALEEDTGKGISEFMGKDLSLVTVRTLIWAGLQDSHEGLTKQQAGNIIDAVGVAEISAQMEEALKAAFPEAEETKAGNGKKVQ